MNDCIPSENCNIVNITINQNPNLCSGQYFPENLKGYLASGVNIDFGLIE